MAVAVKKRRAKPESLRAALDKRKVALVMRTCDAERQGYGGFQYPKRGAVSAPDWKQNNECGQGLHGWLWGEGDGALGDWSAEAVWLVLEVVSTSIVSLGGKVKFPGGTVVHCGNRDTASRFLVARGGDPTKVIGYTATAGDGGTATAGVRGTATAGYGGTVEIRWWDTAAARARTAVGYIGEGLKPGSKYMLDAARQFVEVDPAPPATADAPASMQAVTA